MSAIVLDYAPYEYQLALHTSPTRFKMVVGGRRVGKSKMALQEMIKHCLSRPKATAWWVAPTYAMAREVGWEEFKEYEEALSPVIASVHETLLKVKFLNGSVMYFKGGDNERSLRGRGLTYLVIDEAAFVDQLIWTRALRPALSDKDGGALLISTPNGRNWFYELAQYAVQPENNWEYHWWPTQMNPLIGPEELQEAANSISAMDFRQEYLAEFVTRAGLVYDEFKMDAQRDTNGQVIEPTDPDGNLLDPLNLINPAWANPHEFELFLGIDFGYANPTAICFMAVEPKSKTVYMFDEIYVSRAKMGDIQSMIVQKLASHGLQPHDIKAIYTDPAGNAAELTSGESPVDELRMGPYRFSVINKGTEIAPGVGLVRSFIRSASGLRRFFITTNCREAIRSISGYTYDKKDKSEVVKEEPLKDGLNDHMCDAIRYFFVNRFDTAKYVAQVPEQYDYAADQQTGRTVLKRCPTCRGTFVSHTPKNQPPFECQECITNAH